MRKPTYKSTLAACCSGYVTQAIVVNLAPLFFVIFQTDFGISYSFIATLVLLMFAIQLVIDIAAIWFVRRLGYRLTAILSQVTSALGLIMLGILPRVIMLEAGILIASLTYSVGGGLIEVIISPISDALPHNNGSASMSMLHSFYSWGQVAVIALSTVLLRLIGGELWYILPMLWAILPIYNVVSFLRVPIIENSEPDDTVNLSSILTNPVFLLALLMMICSGASEQSMAQWASLFAEKGLGVSKVVGDLFGPCLFGVFMAVGRMLYGIYGTRLNLRRVLSLSSLLTLICYLLTVFADLPALSLAGCALCGLGVSLMWPGMLGMVPRRIPGGGAMIFALLAFGGDVGCSVGPYLTGVVSDLCVRMPKLTEFAASVGISGYVQLKSGILASIIFPLIMFICVTFFWRDTGKSDM